MGTPSRVGRVRRRCARLWRAGIAHTGVSSGGRGAGARKSCRRTGGSVRSCPAGSCGGLPRCRGAPTLPRPAAHGGSRPARGRSPGPARMRPAAATDGYGRFAAPSVPIGRLPGTRPRRLSANGLAARGFLRPGVPAGTLRVTGGWSEEPAPDPPRLRERGRGSGDRAVAVDEAVMGITSSAVGRSVGGVGRLALSTLSSERGAFQAGGRSHPSSVLADGRQGRRSSPWGVRGAAHAYRRAPTTERGSFSGLGWATRIRMPSGSRAATKVTPPLV